MKKMQNQDSNVENVKHPEGAVFQEHEKHKHPVIVTVDGKERHVKPGSYVVSEFKRDVHVDAAKELDEVVNGQFVPLDDNATITIKGGEHFVSHVRRGGSS
jgi:hypothetical protein